MVRSTHCNHYNLPEMVCIKTHSLSETMSNLVPNEDADPVELYDDVPVKHMDDFAMLVMVSLPFHETG